MVFCNLEMTIISYQQGNVTILILIDGFLQFNKETVQIYRENCHNPYFNRWFSAMNTGMDKPVEEVSQSLF